MNNKLLQINDNFGVVSDENGNLGIISKANNKYSFEDSLVRENKLKELQEEKKNLTYKISAIKTYSDLANFAVILGIGLSSYAYLFSNCNFGISLTIGYVPLKIVSLITCDNDAGFASLFRIGRVISLYKCSKRRKELKKIVPVLEKELYDMTTKSLYLGSDIDLSKAPITQERLHKSADNIRMVNLSDNSTSFAFKDCTGTKTSGKKKVKRRNN